MWHKSIVCWLVVGSSLIVTRNTSNYRLNALHEGLSKGSQPEFKRYKNGKLRTARSTNTTGNLTRHLPSTSSERRTATKLVGQTNVFFAFFLVTLRINRGWLCDDGWFLCLWSHGIFQNTFMKGLSLISNFTYNTIAYLWISNL